MWSIFWHQPFVVVAGILGVKVLVVDDVLSFQEQEIFPTTSLDENYIEFEFRTDRNYRVNLRQTYLALKLNFFKDVVSKLKIPKKEHKEEAKMDEEATAEEQEAPVSLVTHVNNIFSSMFSIVEVYMNNQRVNKSNSLYAHKSYISNNFMGAITEYKGVLHCERCDCEEFPEKIIGTILSKPFLTRRKKMLSRPDGFMLYGKLGVDLFSTS